MVHVWDCDGSSFGPDGLDHPCTNCEVEVDGETTEEAMAVIIDAYKVFDGITVTCNLETDTITVVESTPEGDYVFNFTHRVECESGKYGGEGMSWADFE